MEKLHQRRQSRKNNIGTHKQEISPTDPLPILNQQSKIKQHTAGRKHHGEQIGGSSVIKICLVNSIIEMRKLRYNHQKGGKKSNIRYQSVSFILLPLFRRHQVTADIPVEKDKDEI